MRNQQEFIDFVAARRTHLRRIAFALTGDWHLAEDITQTTLTKLYVAWPRVSGSADAYARTIIVRTVVDEARRPWRREVAGLVADSPVGELTETPDGLIAALQELPSMQRSAVVLRHWLDLSVEETARELGISPGTVKSHTSRALSRLHDRLVEQGALDE